MTFLQKKISSRSLEVRLDFPETLPRAWADEEHWQRIIMNLFLNTLAFLPAGGHIRLQGRHEEKSGYVEVVFSDNGPGISAEQARRIFEPFFSTRPDGTGLGLFLVRHWLEEMHGSIELASRPGEGAAFKILLSLEKPQTRIEPAVAFRETEGFPDAEADASCFPSCPSRGLTPPNPRFITNR